MSTVVGKDPNGRIWFKSDRHLTDITEATDFHVKPVGLLRKTWQLIAIFTQRPAYYQDEQRKRGLVQAITKEKVIGVYKKEISASYALNELMELKEIKVF